MEIIVKRLQFLSFGSIRVPKSYAGLLVLLLTLAGCGGGGGGGSDDDSASGVGISGAILVPGGTVNPANPIGLQGAANRPVSLYRIDDSGQIIGNVLDTSTSDQNGNYVMLLPDNIPFSSDIIVQANLGVDPMGDPILARAIVIDESTDISPITEYITTKLIDDPNLDLSALPLDEVIKLVEFVESLPLGPQPDLSSMLTEIATFSNLVIEAEINDLNTNITQIRLSGLLSVPAPPAPKSANFAQRPIDSQLIELFLIDNDGNPIGGAIASATTNAAGVFTILLPPSQDLSASYMLRAITIYGTVRALVTDDILNVDATSEFVFQEITQTPNLDLNGLLVGRLDDLVEFVYTLSIPETSSLVTTLADIDTAAGPQIMTQINDIIVDANVSAPVVDAAGPFALLENSINSTAVATATATDADPVGSVTGFSITAGNTGNAFAIDNAGAITVANSLALDREINASFTLTITATDGTNVSIIGEGIVINLDDENDNAPVVTPAQSFVVIESAIDTTPFGTVNTTDVDTTGTISGFAITGGNTGTVFAIDAAGTITVANASALDRESIPAYTLTITADDGVNTSAVESIAITITDSNDTPPVVDVVGPFALAEDAVNTTAVGTVTATDVDTTGSVTGFNITAGNTGSAFTIDAGGIISVADTNAIDVDTSTSFILTITASDGINTSVGQPVTINISDANDTAPIVDTVGPFAVAEDAIDTTFVGTVTATDVDTVGSVTGFAITAGNTGNAFSIDAAGAIRVADTSAIDFENTTSFVLSVTATDSVNTSTPQPVTVNVSDVNDTGPVVDTAGPFAIAENSANTTAVGTATATDVDTIGSVTGFNITAGNTGTAFAIDAAGAITVANTLALDRETNASFTLTITATDGTNVSAGEDIVVNLTDVNDTAPVVTPGQTLVIPSTASNNDVVGNVIATDADTTGAVTGFNITAGNTGNTFAIAANGEVTVADNTNLLAGSPYTLSIEATDGTNTSSVETVSITVTTGGGAVWDSFNWDGSTWQ